MSPTGGVAVNLDKEGFSNLSFCNTVLISVVFALNLEFPSKFLYIN